MITGHSLQRDHHTANPQHETLRTGSCTHTPAPGGSVSHPSGIIIIAIGMRLRRNFCFSLVASLWCHFFFFFFFLAFQVSLGDSVRSTVGPAAILVAMQYDRRE